MKDIPLFSRVIHPRFGQGTTDSAVSVSTGTVRVFFRDRDRIVKASDLQEPPPRRRYNPDFGPVYPARYNPDFTPDNAI